MREKQSDAFICWREGHQVRGKNTAKQRTAHLCCSFPIAETKSNVAYFSLSVCVCVCRNIQMSLLTTCKVASTIVTEQKKEKKNAGQFCHTGTSFFPSKKEREREKKRDVDVIVLRIQLRSRSLSSIKGKTDSLKFTLLQDTELLAPRQTRYSSSSSLRNRRRTDDVKLTSCVMYRNTKSISSVDVAHFLPLPNFSDVLLLARSCWKLQRAFSLLCSVTSVGR